MIDEARLRFIQQTVIDPNTSADVLRVAAAELGIEVERLSGLRDKENAMTLDLDALEALERAATPRPWTHDGSAYVYGEDGDDPIIDCDTPVNAELTASIRNAAPEIFESLRALTAERDALRAERDRLRVALMPFARIGATHGSVAVSVAGASASASDFRAAHRALGEEAGR